MENIELLSQIFEVCIIPLLGVLTAYLVKFIQKKSNELQANTDSEILDKYICMLTETVINCVIATNQTYVDNLKREGKFDAAAQKEAFNRTYAAVLSILTDDAKKYLTGAFGDLQLYINQLIESEVNKNKLTICE